PKDVMRPKTCAGIRGRAQMRKVDRASVASWDAAAMRPDPAPVPRPNLLQRCAHAQFPPLQPIGQFHDRLSASKGRFGLMGGATIAGGVNRSRWGAPRLTR